MLADVRGTGSGLHGFVQLRETVAGEQLRAIEHLTDPIRETQRRLATSLGAAGRVAEQHTRLLGSLGLLVQQRLISPYAEAERAMRGSLSDVAHLGDPVRELHATLRAGDEITRLLGASFELQRVHNAILEPARQVAALQEQLVAGAGVGGLPGGKPTVALQPRVRTPTTQPRRREPLFHRESRRVRAAGNVGAVHWAKLALLHPTVAEKAWPVFAAGQHDLAVFQAYRLVEIAVRDAGAYPLEAIGVDLMRRAFHPEAGPLRDPRAPAAERHALCSLFAGAIGLYKNPYSHREVGIEPKEAVELLVLASHLLRIVDTRQASGQQDAQTQ